MNTIKKLELVNELCKKINEYVYKYDLFAGGCCYAAYVLAKNLKQLGIKYKTVLYQYDDILNETNFNNAINGRGVSHVAIEVEIGIMRYTIGDCSGLLYGNHLDDHRCRNGRLKPYERPPHQEAWNRQGDRTQCASYCNRTLWLLHQQFHVDALSVGNSLWTRCWKRRCRTQ